jgi:hypothetical protein
MAKLQVTTVFPLKLSKQEAEQPSTFYTIIPGVLFRKVWETEELPQDWKHNHLIKYQRKECKNWRGITVLSIPGKEFNSHPGETKVEDRQEAAGRTCRIMSGKIVYRSNSCSLHHHLAVFGIYGIHLYILPLSTSRRP